MDKLQKTVSSEGRFKNLRETLKKYVYFVKLFIIQKYFYSIQIVAYLILFFGKKNKWDTTSTSGFLIFLFIWNTMSTVSVLWIYSWSAEHSNKKMLP